MDGQPSAVEVVRFIAKKIEKLTVHERGDEIEGAVGIADDNEQRRLAVAERVKLQFVGFHEFAQLFDIERRKPRTAGNQDTFECFARRHLEFSVLLDGEMLRVTRFQIVEKQVNGAFVFLVVLSGFAGIDEIKQRYEVLFVLRRLVPDVADQRRVVEPFRLYPKIFARLVTLAFGIHNQGVHQLQNILFRADVRKRIVFHGFSEIDEVQALDTVMFPFKQPSDFVQDRSFGVGHDIGGMALQEGRFCEKPCFAAARAADHKNVFVSCVFRLFRSA